MSEKLSVESRLARLEESNKFIVERLNEFLEEIKDLKKVQVEFAKAHNDLVAD